MVLQYRDKFFHENNLPWYVTRYRDAHVLVHSYTLCMSNIEVPAVSIVLLSRIPWFKMAMAGQHPPALENAVSRKERLQPSYSGAAEQIFLTETGLWMLRSWTTLPHVSFDLGPRPRKNKEPLTRTTQENSFEYT